MFFPPNVLASDGDVQLWVDQEVRTRLSERFRAKVKQSFRFRDDVDTFGMYVVEGGLTSKTFSWLDLGLFYRYVREESEGEWLDEYRPYGDATIHWKLWDIAFSDRNRAEFRSREARTDKWRYRNRLMAVFPLRWTDIDLRPYISAEAFFDESIRRGDRNRVRSTFGIKTHPRERLRKTLSGQARNLEMTSDFYVSYQSTERDEETVNDYIIGINLGCSF
jgi:hypothetical protein